MNDDLRIGHRGLERRDADDTYWLNGTRIDVAVYNHELQRQIAYAAEQRHARDVRESIEHAYKHEAEQQKLLAMQNAAFLSINYPRLYGRKSSVESDQSGERAREDSAKAAQAAYEELEKRKPVHARLRETPSRLSLKTTPLFGHLRWRFDSPFNPLRRQLFRWAYRTHRSMA